MGTSIEQEFYNQIFPLANSPGMRAQAAFPTNPTGGVINLGTEFGPTGLGGHFLTAKAENLPSGAAVYLALSQSPTFGVNPGSAGPGATGLGYPLFNGQEVRGRIPGGSYDRVPTLAGYPTGGYTATLTGYYYLHHRVNSQAGGTGAVLRLLRSSLLPTQQPGDPGGFPVPQ